MSRIIDLGPKDIKLPSLLAEYEDALIGIEDALEIKGKNIEVANRENPKYTYMYDRRKCELDTLVLFFQARVKKARGKLYKSYMENHKIDLNHTAMEKYIDTEPSFISINELLLEVLELRNKFASAVEAFKVRGYALNNITKIRIASLEETDVY